MIRKAVLERIKALLGDMGGAPARAPRHEAHQLAAAALLVEAASMDDSFDTAERSTILKLLTAHFGLSAGDADELLRVAEAEVAESNHLYAFTKTVKDAFDHEQRIEVLEMLWEVAYTDGELHDYEANLIRRVTGLLHLSDRESGAARKRVLERAASKT